MVWERQRKEGQEGYDCIPFLGVSRSLGDFWSFNPRTKQFIVSPKPDVYAHPLNPKEQKFVVIASDGLWNVMTPDEVVRFIWDYENSSTDSQQPRDVVRAVINQALNRWAVKYYPADNIAVLIAFLSESSGVKSNLRQPGAVPRDSGAFEAQEASSMSEIRTKVVVASDNCDTPTKLPEAKHVVQVYKTSELTGRPGHVHSIPNDLHRSSLEPENSPSKLLSIGKHTRTDNSSEAVPSLKRSKLDCSPRVPLNSADEVAVVDSSSESQKQSVRQLSEIMADDDSGVHSDDAGSEDVPGLSDPASACVRIVDTNHMYYSRLTLWVCAA